MDHRTPTTRSLAVALGAPDPSTRLRAAMAAGTQPGPGLVDDLVARFGVEPDFFVRDMLTWALTRLPAEVTVPQLVAALESDVPQTRSQALHTLSKVADRAAWPSITAALLHDDAEVARAAWRAAVVLVPPGEETALATELSTELGRGDLEVRRSLGRALAALDDAAREALMRARSHPEPEVRAHAEATLRLLDDPDSDFAHEVDLATTTRNRDAPC